MKYGYCRISTKKQNIERQIRNILTAFPDAKIIQEVYTRTSLNRKEWNKLYEKVKSGDTIIFDSVSRMSGNAVDGFAAYQELYNRGVNLVFIKERHIDTDTYKKALQNNIKMTGNSVDLILEGVNKYLMTLAEEQIRLAFAQSEKEVQDLRQRTKEGIETARKSGKQVGQEQGKKLNVKKSATAKEIIKRYSRDFDGSLEDQAVIKLAEISRNTYYKYKKELKMSASAPSC